MLDQLQEKLRGRPLEREDDVADDQHLAQSRDTGGSDRDDGDAASTTVTGRTEEYVGRVAGSDEGAEGRSGAEARSFGPDETGAADEDASRP